jgi:hypothetical protein
MTPLSIAKACVVPSHRAVKVSNAETISIFSCEDRYLCSVCSWNVKCLKYKQKDLDLEVGKINHKNLHNKILFIVYLDKKKHLPKYFYVVSTVKNIFWILYFNGSTFNIDIILQM